MGVFLPQFTGVAMELTEMQQKRQKARGARAKFCAGVFTKAERNAIIGLETEYRKFPGKGNGVQISNRTAAVMRSAAQDAIGLRLRRRTER